MDYTFINKYPIFFKTPIKIVILSCRILETLAIVYWLIDWLIIWLIVWLINSISAIVEHHYKNDNSYTDVSQRALLLEIIKRNIDLYKIIHSNFFEIVLSYLGKKIQQHMHITYSISKKVLKICISQFPI